MRVLAGPRLDLEHDPTAALVARRLAGPDGAVVSLAAAGIRNLSRRLSAAEVALLRAALEDGRPGDTPGVLIGYVCRGRRPGGVGTARAGAAGSYIVAVSDHMNLSWQSPLAGPNDDTVGPRFPSTTGIYAPGPVVERLGTAEGMIVRSGEIAGVRDDEQLSEFEIEMAGAEEVSAASSELVPVAIVAAHMGLRVAAAVIIEGQTEGEG